MFRSLIVVLLGLAATPVFAADARLFNQPGRSYFEQLLSIFEQSRPATTDEANGWFSGRCYRWETPSLPFGTVFVGRFVDVHGDPSNGPLFPPGAEKFHQYNVFGLGRQGSEAPPEYWDTMTPAKIAFVEERVNAGMLQDSYPTRGSLDMQFPQGNLFMSTRLYPTNQGVDPATLPGYLVTRMAVMSDMPPYRAGTIFAMCYYFKKVR